MPDRTVILKILDLARWAPSGDNTQPWRFEIVSDNHIAIHGFDTRDWCLYDFEGHASHMAHGALLETLRIAATGFGIEATWNLRDGCPDTAPIYDVRLQEKTDEVSPDPLLAYIEARTVQRRPMHTTPLTEEQQQALAAAPGPAFEVRFFETRARKRKIARLLWRNAYIRLTCPEAYPVHRDIIEWEVSQSKDRIPAAAVGVDPMTARLMKWVMQSWKRVDFFNRYLLGTIAPRLQLDFIPALACAAHLLLIKRNPLADTSDYVSAGVALQRLWLTATSVGLHLQPEMTPVIFRWYSRAGRGISKLESINSRLQRIAGEIEAITDCHRGDAIAFMCRVGISPRPEARSIRKDLQDLMASDVPAGTP